MTAPPAPGGSHRQRPEESGRQEQQEIAPCAAGRGLCPRWAWLSSSIALPTPGSSETYRDLRGPCSSPLGSTRFLFPPLCKVRHRPRPCLPKLTGSLDKAGGETEALSSPGLLSPSSFLGSLLAPWHEGTGAILGPSAQARSSLRRALARPGRKLHPSHSRPLASLDPPYWALACAGVSVAGGRA